MIQLFAAGHRLGIIHVYIGQEGTGAAILQAISAEDFIFTNHRNHGHVIGRGVDPGKAFAELLGRSTGLLGGRGGGQHLSDPSHGILHTSAIVGGAISLAVGAAYALKRRGDGGVAIAFFGDSTLEEGVAYEALNLAAMWKLPIIFVCENNSVKAQGVINKGYPTLVHAAENLSRIPESLGITTHRIADGADVSEVYAAAQAAREVCRNGGGPVFLEALTVRWPGSQTLIPQLTSITDLEIDLDARQRIGAEQDWASQHDPLLRWISNLKDREMVTQDYIRSLDATIASQIKSAAQFAEDSPHPDPKSASARIYA